ncbi:MAG: hypothetical protein A2Y90_03265 [Chloroflexi bacterium RBG_13_52_12]|nr:MAG: hypothetical protein A2Y90_03265 [Chloroflexi bacterium RBG_13_52_12]
MFTLLGVLAAIMIPNVAGFIGFGHTQAAATELSIIQTAMDSMMAGEDMAAVTEVTVATDNMSKFPDEVDPLYPTYLRDEFTKGTYECDTTGLVEQVDDGY